MEGRLLLGTDLSVHYEEETEPRTRARSEFQKPFAKGTAPFEAGGSQLTFSNTQGLRNIPVCRLIQDFSVSCSIGATAEHQTWPAAPPASGSAGC